MKKTESFSGMSSKNEKPFLENIQELMEKLSLSQKPLTRARQKKLLLELNKKNPTQEKKKTVIRRREKKIIPTFNLGKLAMSYKSASNKHVEKEDIQNFIQNNIGLGPQLVTLPVPPDRHVFLVDVKSDIIMIGDWNGNENIKKKGVWKTYSNFMKALQTYFALPIQFYEIDFSLKKKAEQKADIAQGGGCSEYIFHWLKKNPEYANKYAI